MSGRVFRMPDLGEGLEEGEIVAWLVEVGDTVALNQPLVEVETACPFTANTISLNPPASFSLVESVSVRKRRRSA